MYTIQYKDPVTRESKMQDCDVHRDKLLKQLATFEYEIFNVYENGTRITKRTRADLKRQADTGLLKLNDNARNFINCPL